MFDTSEFFISVTNKCKNIKCLDLDYCHVISGAALQKFGKFKHFEYLTIEDESNVINDDVIFEITSKCKKLKKLHLRDIKNVSAFTLEKIGNLGHLEKLDLYKVNNIDDNVILNAVRKCKNLKKLAFNSRTNATALRLRELGNLENLESLVFDEDENADDSVIINIASKCKKLEKLSVYRDSSVSFSSVKAIIQNCPNLKYLLFGKNVFTLEMLIFATEHTRHRQNNIILHIHVNSSLLEQFLKLRIESPFLKLDSYT